MIFITMPELPEVETIARGLAKRVTGDVIESVWLGQKREPLKSPAAEIASVLEQSRITEVRRMGKHIIFDLERVEHARVAQTRVARALLPANGRGRKRTLKKSKAALSTLDAEAGGSARSTLVGKAQWIVHLGMTGRLQVC